jgi:FKBP-type peptidyl-prolyl cis-trans isomerase
MTSKRCLLFAVAAVVVLASCGDPNASDTPGAITSVTPAGSQAAPTPTPTPAPQPAVAAADITTPCTKGKSKTTPGGVKIKDTKCGTGKEATKGSIIKVKYVGKLSSGKVFDSSAKHGGKPVKFPIGVGQVIPGWDEAIPGMRVGGVRTLVIPPAMAYGSAKAGTIPPNSTLVFQVKLLGVSGA